MSALDYQRIAAYWRTAAEEGARAQDPDFAAGANSRVPPSAHRFCRQGQLDYFEEHVVFRARGEDVLDLGCGPGLFALKVAPLARTVLGVDIAPSFVEVAAAEARRRGFSNVRFQVGSLVDFVPEERYGLIVLGGVLLYVGDRELPGLLARVFAALRPGGSVYVRTSTAARRRWQRNDSYPAIYRMPEEYQELFRQAGFTIERSDPDHFYTYADLLTAYFTLLRVATLGLSRKIPGLEDRVFERILRCRRVLLEAPERLIQEKRLPIPHLRSHQFLLRREA